MATTTSEIEPNEDSPEKLSDVEQPQNDYHNDSKRKIHTQMP